MVHIAKQNSKSFEGIEFLPQTYKLFPISLQPGGVNL